MIDSLQILRVKKELKSLDLNYQLLSGSFVCWNQFFELIFLTC